MVFNQLNFINQAFADSNATTRGLLNDLDTQIKSIRHYEFDECHRYS